MTDADTDHHDATDIGRPDAVDIDAGKLDLPTPEALQDAVGRLAGPEAVGTLVRPEVFRRLRDSCHPNPDTIERTRKTDRDCAHEYLAGELS